MGGGIGLWVAAEWRRRWRALVGVALLVALAGGLTTALAAGARRADTAYTRFQDATGEPNLAAQIDLGGAAAISDADAAERLSAHVEALDELASLDGVRSVEVESWWAIALFPEMDPPGVVTAFAIGTFARAGAPATPIVIDGRLPDVTDPDAVTINEEAVRELGLAVGDTLRFQSASPRRLGEWAGNDGQFASPDALDGPMINVRVAAVTRTEEDLEMPFPGVAFPEGFARAHRDDIAHLEAFVYLRVDPDRVDEIAADVEEIVGPHGLHVTATTTGPGAAIVPSIEVGVSTLWIATAVAALGGLLLVAQALGRLVAAAAVDQPALTAMGLTRPQRTLGTVATASVAIVTGALAVPLVASAASGLFPRGAAALVEPRPGLRWDVSTLSTGAALTLVAASLVLLLSAAAASGTRPAHAAGSGRLSGLLRGMPAMSLGASFATDPAGSGRRSRALAGAAAAGIAVAVAAVLVVATLEESRRHLERSPGLFGAVTELVYESNGTFGTAEMIERAAGTPGVTAVTQQLAINDDSLIATGPGRPGEVEPSAYQTMRGGAVPPVADGHYPQGPDEVALGAATAADLGAQVGDDVTIEPIGGGEPLELTVSGTVVAWDTADPQHAFVVLPDTLRTLLCPDVGLADCNVATNVFASASDDTARAALSEVGFRDVAVPANVLRLGQVGPIPWLLAGFLCLFAAAGALHGVLTSLRRRSRDLAIARALGLGPRRAASALTWQAVFTAAVGTAVGVPLGAIAGPAIWRIIATDLGVVVVPRFPVVIALGVALGALAVAIAISVWPRWRACHLCAAEALRSE